MKNIADQMVSILVKAGIKRVYAVTGDSLNFLNEAIKKEGSIKWIHVRHEEVGAFAAAAEAELDGIACCAGSSGPGHVHLINGLYEANRGNVPVLAIASTCESKHFGTQYFQETNTIKLFDDCSVYNEVATTQEQAPRMLQAALQHAISLKGVSVLGVPGDLFEEKPVDNISSDYIFKSNPTITPNKDELNAIAEILNSSQKTAIYCGFGAKESHDEIVELAKKLQAPVGYSFRGKMGIQYDNPYEVGMTGLLGLPSAFEVMHKADVILLLGTDFPYVQFMPIGKTIIQIDEKGERLGRRAQLSRAFVGNIKDSLEALLPLIQTNEDNSFLEKQLDYYNKIKENLHTYVKDEGKTELISPEFVAHNLSELASDDAIFTVDTGMCCVWGARYIQAKKDREMLGSFNHGTMANAMPMAIGAQLAYPERQVISLCGDGGLSMLLGDLATIKQYNLPIKLVVFNNRTLGMVKLEMEVAGIPDNETDMENPDFALVAQAFGIKGIEVKEPNEVESAIKEALQTPGPVLLNVYTNPNALAMPPKIEWAQVKGMGFAMSRMMLDGNYKEVAETIASNYKHIKDIF